ncbi:PadR family transcriptional regulator [Pandoraea nosoerga]|uniref:PadR family transcriptional regulator n=2 Tax=Pandoraea nosoerga TaxID=2508296 RepID=A0A5E4VZ53_9BURK|nr:PadR family transcriptional regulator [Pandoraea nosoerga]MBN4666212.1 PadR family transcriptional regulator [Pandoraea nosoerga]MBN4676267.1 PadR family transcriptional regulator [Pandoraea nosoerga]MBN4681304.1 PadR family transcriptional regulator [Pandoraea nosoerga]MBN4745379.1 PadR family transcriptional regulator [Pandoraea nosoerga]VVE16806.1 PadR family transcriptional regulator [Pandoraea nosoerga]
MRGSRGDFMRRGPMGLEGMDFGDERRGGYGHRRGGRGEDGRDGRDGRDGWDGHGGHGERGARGGRGGRLFSHGGLRLVLLHLIAQQPRHGYELIKAIEESVNGTYSPSAGVVYPTLTLLEEMGYIRVQENTGDSQRKSYEATDAGREYLAENEGSVTELLARLATRRERSEDMPPQVMRALHNFKYAVHLRLGGEPLTTEQANAFAAILDAAAQQLERI